MDFQALFTLLCFSIREKKGSLFRFSPCSVQSLAEAKPEPVLYRWTMIEEKKPEPRVKS